MPDQHFFMSVLSDGRAWLTLAIFVLALAEAFVVTTFLVNGTIAFVVLGGLVARGVVDGPSTMLAIYAGTLAGDALTWLLASRLRRFPHVASRLAKLDRFRGPLASHPARFIAIAHMTPWLKAVVAVLSYGTVPWRTWVRAELVGALCGTFWFVGIGAVASRLLLGAREMGALGFTASALAFAGVVVLWLRAAAPCRIVRTIQPAPAAGGTRSWTRRLFFVLWYPLWNPIRLVEGVARRLPSRSPERGLGALFEDVRAGDIFLVRLHAPAPWGRWAHAAIATGPEGFCHGFGKTITAHRFADFPLRYTIAHLRVRCPVEIAARAAAVASAQVGRPMALFARRNDTSRFSCTSLVVHAYAEAGIDLAPAVHGRVVPDDLFASRSVELVRLAFTEKRRTDRVQAGGAHGSHRIA